MTIPTPDPLALAEEAIRELEQLAAFAIPHGYVMQFDAISALASALRAAQEENARLREALEEREGDMHLRIRAGYDKTVADSWRQENTRLREALGELVAAMERYENEAEGDAPQSHLDMMARVRSALAGGKGEG